jgi:hypothetical protein
LSQNGLGQSAAGVLSALLGQMRPKSAGARLRGLSVAENRLGLDAAQTLCRSAGASETLLWLDLSLNPFF